MNRLDAHADLKTEYGAILNGETWTITLWHPTAKDVTLILFDKDNQNVEVDRIVGNFNTPNWTWSFDKSFNGFFYQYEITQADGKKTLALDPFAKSMASFNWEGKDTNVGKAALVHVEDVKISKLGKVNKPQPIIYEAHIRNLTSLSNKVDNPGSFKALKQAKVAEHLSDLGITHIQFLPIHNCFTLNENDKKILGKGDGSKWNTNYNWGYDPHNYFSINGWFSSNPEDPYNRINELKETVKYFHDNGIKVILDVVYNHMYSNSILNNVVPNYYFRSEDATAKPVGSPAIASESLMMRRIIIESLEWFVKKFDVDGFRFDLMEFTDKTTIDMLFKRLRGIKPNIVIHGEVWNWTDLDTKDTYIKGISDNDMDLAYFNDTIRNAIKGEDDGDGFAIGLIGGNTNEFGKYLSSTFGNLKTFNAPDGSDNDSYSRFTDYPNNNLSYAACHDGHTLWDKINLTVAGTMKTKLEAYRQALIMIYAVPGRVLILEGTELLYTKPNDESGQDSERSHSTEHIIDLFGLGNVYNENSYKTTDYVNGLRWDALKNTSINMNIYAFLKELNNFRTTTNFFNVETQKEISDQWEYINVDSDKNVIDFRINQKGKALRVIHNFSNDKYEASIYGDVIAYSKLDEVKGFVHPKSSLIIIER